jgi:hypothetical protein
VEVLTDNKQSPPLMNYSIGDHSGGKWSSELSKSKSKQGLSIVKTVRWCTIHNSEANHFKSLWLGRKRDRQRSEDRRRSRTSIARRTHGRNMCSSGKTPLEKVNEAMLRFEISKVRRLEGDLDR